MKKIIFIFPIILTLLLSACATKTGLDKYQGQSAQEIFQGADKSLTKGDYKDAAERYEALQALYPYGDYAQQTQLNVIYVYYEDRDYDSCIAAADLYIHLYPLANNTDYAYYMKALAEFSRNIGFFERYLPLDIAPRDIGSLRQAFSYFNDLLNHYPNSIYAPDARQRMIFLRNLLAQHELQIANYYYARQAYVAAAERARYIIVNFQHTPSVAEALSIMVKSYEKLNLPQQANEAKAVLELNYPAQAKRLLKTS